MMNPNQWIVNWCNRPNDEHKRKVGEYYCSEIWSMEKGYLKPEDFFKTDKKNLEGACNIAGGIGDEAMLETILSDLKVPHEHEPKKYIQLAKGIRLAVKPDFVFKDFVLETKSPNRPTSAVPAKWKYQLEAEYQAFKKPVYLGIFRNHPTRRFSLAVYQYQQSDDIYAKIIKIVKDFDKRLRELSV